MSDSNIEIVQHIYAAFGKGDVAAILEHISDDLRHFGVVSEQNQLPWQIQITKKKDVPLFFQTTLSTASRSGTARSSSGAEPGLGEDEHRLQRVKPGGEYRISPWPASRIAGPRSCRFLAVQTLDRRISRQKNGGLPRRKTWQ